MATFIEKFKSLCAQKGTSPNQVAIEVGLPQSVMSDWINGRRNPKPEVVKGYLKKISSSEKLNTSYGILASWYIQELFGPEEIQEAAKTSKKHKAC